MTAILVPTYVDPARLEQELRPLVGSSLEVFEGHELTVPQSRDIARALAVPPSQRRKAIIAAFTTMTEQAALPLLLPLENLREDIVFVLTCNWVPATLRSRLSVREATQPSLDSLYRSFSRMSEGGSLDQLYVEYSHLSSTEIDHLYDSFVVASSSVVSAFLTAVYDGNREKYLSLKLGCSDIDRSFIFMEIDYQLEGKSLFGEVLTGVTRDQLLQAAKYRQSKASPRIAFGAMMRILIG